MTFSLVIGSSNDALGLLIQICLIPLYIVIQVYLVHVCNLRDFMYLSCDFVLDNVEDII